VVVGASQVESYWLEKIQNSVVQAGIVVGGPNSNHSAFFHDVEDHKRDHDNQGFGHQKEGGIQGLFFVEEVKLVLDV